MHADRSSTRLLGMVALATLVLSAAEPATGEMYMWTDDEGVVHFTSNPSEVPPARREAARAAGKAGKGSFQRIETRDRAPGRATPPSGPAAHGLTGTPAARSDGRSDAEELRVGGRTEAEWRAAAEKYRSAIARLEESSEKCAGDRFRWTPGAGRRAYDEEAREAAACQRVANELDMNRRWLEKLGENARRAGAPPGWLRD